MAMITPEMGKPQRDPIEYQFPTAMYLVKLTNIEEAGPSSKFPNGNPRLVFEFTVWEGPFRGKKACQFVGKSLYKDAKTGKESNLVKLARSMGVIAPEKGFDPDALKGKFFNAMCEADESTPDGRTWVRAVTPAGSPGPGGPPASPPPVATPGAPPPRPAGPPPRPAPAIEKYWVLQSDTGDPVAMTRDELAGWIQAQQKSPADVPAVQDGQAEWKTAAAYGFADPLPF